MSNSEIESTLGTGKTLLSMQGSSNPATLHNDDPRNSFFSPGYCCLTTTTATINNRGQLIVAANHTPEAHPSLIFVIGANVENLTEKALPNCACEPRHIHHSNWTFVSYLRKHHEGRAVSKIVFGKS